VPQGGATRTPYAAYPPRRLFAAALLSRVSNEMTPVAVVLLVLDRGESAAVAGITAGAIALPGLASGPVLGAWLDRAERRSRVIAAEQALGAAGLASLALLVGHVPAAATVALAAATGVLQPLSTGGMTSVLTGYAEEGFLPRATSREAASFGAANVAGPLLAAILVGASGAALAVVVQSALKLVAMGATLGAPEPSRTGDATTARASIGATVAAGFRHFAAPGPLAAITAVGAIAMGGRGLLTVAFPFFAIEYLGREQDFSGVLWAAFAAGSTVGALMLTRRAARWPSQWVAVGGASLAGLAMVVVPILDSVWAGLAALAVAGALYGPSLAATFDVRRRWTPPEFLGQVSTTAASVKIGSFALGMTLSGGLVAAIGSAEVIAVAAALHVAAGALGAALLGTRV
jgi:MFS family permease